MNKLRKGDEVVVIAGNDKGKTGHIVSITKDGSRVLVAGVNKKTKHVKPNPQRGIEGGRVEQEATIHISNVMIFNPETKKGDRVRIEVTATTDANGKNTFTRERFFKSTNKKIG
jgi:large subunit ribosomal protein L24